MKDHLYHVQNKKNIHAAILVKFINSLFTVFWGKFQNVNVSNKIALLQTIKRRKNEFPKILLEDFRSPWSLQILERYWISNIKETKKTQKNWNFFNLRQHQEKFSIYLWALLMILIDPFWDHLEKIHQHS